MSSVTKRIGEVKQPRGGYINPSQFKITQLEDNKTLNAEENVHASIMGMVIDYLTRFMLGAEVEEAFKISLMGAQTAALLGNKNAPKEIGGYLSKIKSLDDESIINACKCTTFDVWFRNPMGAMLARTATDTNPDKDTIDNIKVMVERSLSFFKEYGPITVDGFTFEPSGYTATVDSGDGDFLTTDTLWDFKVSKSNPTNKHTLQLLMYWIMGQHSKKAEFKSIKKLGIFNPRLNVVYTLDVSEVPKEVIKEVEETVICY